MQILEIAPGPEPIRELEVWVRSTVAVAYFGEKFLSPWKVKSSRTPVAVSPYDAPPRGALMSAGAPMRSSDSY